MSVYPADNKNVSTILTPEEVAEFLQKSVSWVYKHRQELGGRKLGGAVFFPSKEDLYEYIFNSKRQMAVQLQRERSEVQQIRIQNQKGGKARRGENAERAGEPSSNSGGSNRHGLLGLG